MNFLGKILGKGVSEPIEAVGNVIDKIFTSDEERLSKQAVLEKLKQRPAEVQAELNKLEAQHRSVFVAGWRPFIGWILGSSLACYYIPKFLLGSIMWIISCIKLGAMIPYPLDVGGLHDLVLAMLGMAAIRTYEKKQKLTS
jgi:hypothetical protein